MRTEEAANRQQHEEREMGWDDNRLLREAKVRLALLPPVEASRVLMEDVARTVKPMLAYCRKVCPEAANSFDEAFRDFSDVLAATGKAKERFEWALTKLQIVVMGDDIVTTE